MLGHVENSNTGIEPGQVNQIERQTRFDFGIFLKDLSYEPNFERFHFSFRLSEKGNPENEILSENFSFRFWSKSKSSLSLSQNAVTMPAYWEADCCKDCS